ncbi:MAG: DLW-39 family protein [Actinomycetales bacterium]|nr:DLW-39 family protein [Actinomycetales bacterium]
MFKSLLLMGVGAALGIAVYRVLQQRQSEQDLWSQATFDGPDYDLGAAAPAADLT